MLETHRSLVNRSVTKMAAEVAVCTEINFDMSENHRHDVFSRIETFKKSKLFCDVTIKVGSKKINAHKLLLAASVPYFYAMFTHDVIERKQENILLKDMDAESVETIINFVYTSKVVINLTNVQTLLQVATILQVNLVQQKCCEFLEKQLDPSNCIGIYVFAEMHGCIDLKNTAKMYCNRHFSKVIEEEEFLTLPFERVCWLLSQDELCVKSEIEVFHAATSWMNFDRAERQGAILQVLSLVRLHLLPKQFLVEKLESCDLIAKDPFSVGLLKTVLEELKQKRISVRKRMPAGNVVIFCMGGYNKKSLDSFHCFNPKTESWLNLGDMPQPKSGAGAVFLGGLLYLIGGRTNSSCDKLDSDSVECYDPYTGEWRVTAKLNTPRHRLGVAAIDGTIFAVGGCNTVEKYDADVNRWTQVASMHTRRTGVGVAVLDGILYAVGGYNSENRLSTAECYCPVTNEWKYIAPMNTPRSGAGVIALNGHVYALGGYNDVAQLNTVERYCPSEDRWTLITPMNEHRSALSVAVVQNKLFALGGYNGERFLSSVEVYDPESGEWRMIQSMPDPRSGASVTVGVVPIT